MPDKPDIATLVSSSLAELPGSSARIAIYRERDSLVLALTDGPTGHDLGRIRLTDFYRHAPANITIGDWTLEPVPQPVSRQKE